MQIASGDTEVLKNIDIFSDLRKIKERHQSLDPADVQMIWTCLNYEVLRATLAQKIVIKFIDYFN